MIASFSRNFIFIKTRKTAGTSLEILLSPACGPEDILTPVTPSDERMRMVGNTVAARNFMSDPEHTVPWWRRIFRRRPLEAEARYREAIMCDDKETAKRISSRLKRRGHFYNHMSAKEIKVKLPKLSDSAFKFTVERHPYEKAVSMAFHMAKRKSNRVKRRGSPDITPFLQEVIERRLYDDTSLYLINGSLAVDRVIRQERFSQELREIADQLGITLPETLPHAKGKARLDPRSAHEILTQEQKREIQSSPAFELFGYDP